MILALVLSLWSPPDSKAQLYPVLQEAYQSFEAGRFDDAIVAFERAYAISAEPRFILNIAVSHREADRCVPALEGFDRFFSVCRGCEQADEAAALHQALREHCEVPVQINVEPPAKVVVDGAPLGPSPVAVKLLPGPHVIQAQADGHHPREQALLVQAGQPQTLDLKLEAIAPIPVPPPPPPPPGTDLRPWAWAAFATAGAGAITGGVFGLLLLNDLDEEEAAESRAALESARDAATRDAILAQVGLGVALTGLAAGLTLLWLDDGPTVTPTGQGAAVGFTF